ncbi:hypothetical protein EKN06_01485 [Croceicoccus ponticola]|uniref:Uncharacterized protein n=1 Tax=Croceicoccus ponticola TaxID=2217664 RepID=A0A437H036_9SPHN|nr:hypothetical protein [Croceicoccus ponticola]RVQ68923.1 hypothetical protein EKN06_01485 [Croceicoccus ponticola]
MIRLFAPMLAAGLALGIAAPALAEHHEEMKAEVVERDAKGVATKVKIGETVYDVCTPEAQDGCINPREAGLNFGHVPLDHWPGAPASGLTAAEKMKKPAPAPAPTPAAQLDEEAATSE